MGTKRTFMESGSWAAVQTECNVIKGVTGKIELKLKPLSGIFLKDKNVFLEVQQSRNNYIKNFYGFKWFRSKNKLCDL